MSVGKSMGSIFVFLITALMLVSGCSSNQVKSHGFELEIIKGTLQGEAPVLQVYQHDNVSILVKSDQDITFHIHGYDIEVMAKKGDPLTLEFVADATGRFPFTIHEEDKGDGDHEEHDEHQLGRLEVLP